MNQVGRMGGRGEKGIVVEYSGSRKGLEEEGTRGSITADKVVIAVGGRPSYLSEEECKGAQYAISSDDIFSLK